MMFYPGLDVSRHNGRMDWGKAVTAGITFAAFRCTVGNYYMDSLEDDVNLGDNMRRNYDACVAWALPRTGYHVVKPSISAESQIEYFLEAVDGMVFNFPPVLDVELNDGKHARDVTNIVYKCCKLLWGFQGFNFPIIYTGQWFWNSNILPYDTWQQYPLWVANYTLASSPLMPRDWNMYDIWQWSADGNGEGPTYGAQSKSIDKNRMTQDFWNRYIPYSPGPDPEPEPEPDQRCPEKMRVTLTGEDSMGNFWTSTEDIWFEKE